MQIMLEYGLSNAMMATILAVATACVCRVCRRPAVSHVLWLLVILKLITPPIFKVPTFWPQGEPGMTEAPAEPAGSFEAAQDVSAPTQLAMASLQDMDREEMLALLVHDLAEHRVLREAALAEASSKPSTSDSWVIVASTIRLALPWMAGVWVLGCAVWFGVAAARIWRFHKLLCLGAQAPRRIQLEVDSLAERMGISQAPDVWFVPGRISPLLWALGGRARLVLPDRLWQQLDPEQRSTLLAHELAHARRHDHWIRWLEFVSVGLYWWHPVAWWARHELQQAEEQCCDAWVVQTFPWAGKAYARALLKTVSFLDAQPAMPPVASGAGHVQSLKRRLNMIVRTPLSPRAPWYVNAGLILTGLVLLPATPLRLEASNLFAGPMLNNSDDDPPQDASRNRVRELENRIRSLEERLDRILRRLDERGRSAESADQEGQLKKRLDETRARAEEQARRAEELAQTAMKRAEEQVRRAEQRARELAKQAEERGRDAAARAERMVIEARKRAEDQVKKAQEKVRTERRVIKVEGKDDGRGEEKRIIELKLSPDAKPHVIEFDTKDEGNSGEKKRHRIVIDGKEVLDSKMLEDLHKQIEKGIHESINPERIKKLEKQIEESVQKSINPERLQRLEREIERAVEQNLNPQKMEALAKQIESAVGRSLKDAEREKGREQTRSSRSSRASTSRSEKSDKSADLEKRLDQLEKKMDKVLRALEASQKSSH